MKVLLVHTRYRELGGEDSVVEQEELFLNGSYDVRVITFKNAAGIMGWFQFIISYWNIFSALQLKRVITDFKPDVIHIHNWHFASGPVIFRVAKKCNIPVVHTLHNFRLLCPSAILFHDGQVFENSLREKFPWTAVWKGVFRNSTLLTFWLAFIVWFHKKIGTWKMVDRYVCLTPFAKKIFVESDLQINEERFHIKPNFISKEQLIDSGLFLGNAYLFVGRLSAEKGIHTLLEAFAGNEHSLFIAGDGLLKGVVEQYCSAHKNIKYLGQLDKVSIIQIMRQSKALVFPSICFEGMPMTIIESLSFGLPVLASDLGAMQSIIVDGENGFLFKPGNVEHLIDTVQKFDSLSNIDRDAMVRRAFSSFNEKYSETQQFDYFNELYCFE